MIGEASEVARGLWREHEAMRSARAVHEGRWRQLAQLVWPAHGDFSGFLSPQAPSPDLDFDSTARRAAARFAALLVQVMTPQHERWHHLKPTGAAKRSHAAALYLQLLRDRLFERRYRPRSGFGNATFETFMQLGTFGTGIMFTPERAASGMTYQAVPLQEIYIGTDEVGRIDRVQRRYRLTARQAVDAFPAAGLPEKIVRAAKDAPETTFEFLHCVKPRDNVDPERLDDRSLPIASYHLSVEGKVVLRESGYRTMPYLVFRYLGTPNNPWGISPADLALADTRMVNRMEKSQLNAANRMADPIWIATDDNLPPPKLIPNAVNTGWLDPVTGRPLIQELGSQARLDIGEAKLEQKREAIESAFLGDFFRTLVENPNMKATQVLELAAARAEQTAPFIARTQEELFGPMIERELESEAAAGRLPPPPPELVRAGGEYDVEYDSPISRSLKAGEAVGIMRTVEATMQIEAVAPGSRNVLDGVAAIRHLAAAYGVPVDVLRSEDALRQIQEQAQAQEEAAAMAEAAPGIAGAVKDLASAGMAGASAGRAAA